MKKVKVFTFNIFDIYNMSCTDFGSGIPQNGERTKPTKIICFAPKSLIKKIVKNILQNKITNYAIILNVIFYCYFVSIV
jgi:hypothetical protein